MRTLTASHFITHKKAETLDDCQDAYAENAALGRYAVADGATRSFFPKEWAELLVEHFCHPKEIVLSLTEENWQEWITPIQQKWYKQVEEKVNSQNLFYLKNSLIMREPAVSTFIGLEIDSTKGEWRAMIIGDSCLFHKSDSGFQSYLIEKSEDFTNLPEAFASFPNANPDSPTFITGYAAPGDMFVMATDALAKWILHHQEIGQLDEVLTILSAVESDGQFYEFVDRARAQNTIQLVNDDVAYLSIAIAPVQEVSDSQFEETQWQDFLPTLFQAAMWLLPGSVVLVLLYLVFRLITGEN